MGFAGRRQLPAMFLPSRIVRHVGPLRLGQFGALIVAHGGSKSWVLGKSGHAGIPFLNCCEAASAASRSRVSGGDGGGKQASRGPGCTEPEPLGAGGGSWAEDLFGGEKGQSPSAPSKRRVCGDEPALLLTCALLMQSRGRRGIPARRPIRPALSDSVRGSYRLTARCSPQPLFTPNKAPRPCRTVAGSVPGGSRSRLGVRRGRLPGLSFAE